MAGIAFLSLIFSLGIFYNAWDPDVRGLTKKALLSILFGIAFAICSGHVFHFNPSSTWAPRTSASYGFGPDWQCFRKPSGPICFKPGSLPQTKGN
jgi:phosphoglycerol transferase MdoB-like AlkP superfamily enzyme